WPGAATAKATTKVTETTARSESLRRVSSPLRCGVMEDQVAGSLLRENRPAVLRGPPPAPRPPDATLALQDVEQAEDALPPAQPPFEDRGHPGERAVHDPHLALTGEGIVAEDSVGTLALAEERDHRFVELGGLTAEGDQSVHPRGASDAMEV